MGSSRSRGSNISLNKKGRLSIRCYFVKHHRQHVGYRCTSIASFSEGTPTAKHQQSASAFAHKVRNHSKLIWCKVVCLDASKNECSILKELLSSPGKSTSQVLSILDPHPHEFIFCRALQNGELQVVIFVNCSAKKLHLPSRLSLKVENLLTCVLDHDQCVAHIILGHHLTRLRRDSKAEKPWTCISGTEPNPHCCWFTVFRKDERFIGHDSSFVFNL